MPLSTSILAPRPAAHLYRQVLKAVPKTIVLFDLSMTEAEVRDSVRFLFRKHTALGKDGRPLPLPRPVLDRLLYDGEQVRASARSGARRGGHRAETESLTRPPPPRGAQNLRGTLDQWNQKTHLDRLLGQKDMAEHERARLAA